MWREQRIFNTEMELSTIVKLNAALRSKTCCYVGVFVLSPRVFFKKTINQSI